MPDDADQTADAQTHSSKTSELGGRFWQTLRPTLEQSALNLRVWLPVLSTPDMKGRQVKYRARENRVGLKWQLALPKQCWQCGKTDDLQRQETNRSVRCFDNAVAIISGSYGSALALLLVWVFAPWEWPLKLALLLAVGGSLLLFIKSWKERVRIIVWTCPDHAAELPPCSCAVNEDDLYLFVPSESLAEAAQAELQAARRRETGSPVKKTEGESLGPPPSDNQAAPPGSMPGPRKELPPLKLDGDEAEAAAPPSADTPPPSSTPSPRTELPPLKLAGDEDEPASP